MLIWTEITSDRELQSSSGRRLFFVLKPKHIIMDVASVAVVRVDLSLHEHPPRESQFFYGTLSVSSASTRQDWSVSRTRNGGWYSNAVKMVEPRLFFWCRNQITAEIPMIATTLRMTRADSNALGPEEDKSQCEEGHHYKRKSHRGTCKELHWRRRKKSSKIYLLCLPSSSSAGNKKQHFEASRNNPKHIF